jgi:hypothetical protein
VLYFSSNDEQLVRPCLPLSAETTTSSGGAGRVIPIARKHGQTGSAALVFFRSAHRWAGAVRGESPMHDVP